MPISQDHHNLFQSSTANDKLNLFQSLLDTGTLTSDEALALLNSIHVELERPEGHNRAVYTRYAQVMESLRLEMPNIYTDISVKWKNLHSVLQARVDPEPTLKNNLTSPKNETVKSLLSKLPQKNAFKKATNNRKSTSESSEESEGETEELEGEETEEKEEGEEKEEIEKGEKEEEGEEASEEEQKEKEEESEKEEKEKEEESEEEEKEKEEESKKEEEGEDTSSEHENGVEEELNSREEADHMATEAAEAVEESEHAEVEMETEPLEIEETDANLGGEAEPPMEMPEA